jgi:hypothetical protein
MSERWTEWSPGLSGDVGRDMELARVLEVVDPASRDPNYWFVFRDWVLRNASPELARRRILADVTVGDVMTSWARTVVPTALLAAALAGIIMIKGQSARALPPVRLEEILVADLEGPTIPVDLALTEPGSAVAFAEGSF